MLKGANMIERRLTDGTNVLHKEKVTVESDIEREPLVLYMV